MLEFVDYDGGRVVVWRDTPVALVECHGFEDDPGHHLHGCGAFLILSGAGERGSIRVQGTYKRLKARLHLLKTGAL